jgi:ribose transport system ATP-binding protein
VTLSVQDLHKSYSGHPVLQGVNLEVSPGEVHALLGANGAGKSTLIKCLGGATHPDRGHMVLAGRPLRDLTPAHAFAAGIATIHQHLSLVDSLSVSDNLFLGTERTRAGLVARRSQRAQTAELLERFAIPVSPGARVGDLPIGTKQLLEIAKAWHRTKVQVLILDEPTASLSTSETERLFAEIERLKERGVRIIYTTHRLGEVFSISDRVSVLRDGKVELAASTRDISSGDIVEAISRGGVTAPAGGDDDAFGSVVVRVESLQGPTFGPVSLEVRAGEVLGIYGALGSGRTSILETIAGRFSPLAGTVTVDGRALPPGGPGRAIAAGVALVPSDRHRQALLGSRSAAENLLLPSYRRLGTFGRRRRGRERSTFRETAARLDLHPCEPDRAASAFSGGNQQKLVVGRWMARADELRLLVLDEPTQGVDVGARQQIYDALRTLARSRGIAVLFSSAEAEEIVALGDAALVVDRGRVVDRFDGDAITEELLIRAAHQFAAEETK